MRVRLVSYNLMNGGEGRADPIAEVLLAQRAGIIGVHEATHDEVLTRLARRLGMEFVVAESDGGRIGLYTSGRILASSNIGVLHHSTMPILDAIVRIDGREVFIRVAHVTGLGEAERMAERLRSLAPTAMLMSFEPPVGSRVVDGQIVSAREPIPHKTHAPVRQLDQVLVRPGVQLVESWIEQDRLAYYASDHLPAGAEIELS